MAISAKENIECYENIKMIWSYSKENTINKRLVLDGSSKYKTLCLMCSVWIIIANYHVSRRQKKMSYTFGIGIHAWPIPGREAKKQNKTKQNKIQKYILVEEGKAMSLF